MSALTVAAVVEPLWHTVPGGTGRYVAELTAELDRRPDVDVVGVTAAHRGRRPEGLAPGIRVRSSRLPRPVWYEAWARTGRPTLRRLAPNAEVVHATTVLAPTAERRPLVVTAHDLLFADVHAGFSNRVRALLALGWAASSARADIVLCPSVHTAHAVQRAGVEAERVRIVAEGVRREELRPGEAGAITRRLGLDRPFVLWVGTIEPRKNLPAVLASFRAVSAGCDHDLVLVGPDGWGPRLSELIGASGAPVGRVKVLGRVNDLDLAGLYTAADLLCWPSLGEGFGLPVLEAQAYGTPVVTSLGTASAELVEDGGLLVDPTDVTAISEAVAALLGDEAERQRRGAAGARTASRYTWEEAARSTAAIYRELAG